MSNRETLDYDPVDALIEQGRRELAAGKIEKAQWCFEEVLRRRPDEPRALLGLSYAARKSEAPPSSEANAAVERQDRQDQLEGAASVLAVDVEVVELVREKRYGEALQKLRAELSKRPEDRALLRSIAHLERHIARSSARPERRRSEPTGETLSDDVSASPITKLRVPNIEGMDTLKETQDFEAPKELVEAKAAAEPVLATPSVVVAEPVVAEPVAAEPVIAIAEPIVVDPALSETAPRDAEAVPVVSGSSADPDISQTEATATAATSPVFEVDPNATQPFELSKVIPSRRPKVAAQQGEAELNQDAEDEAGESLVDSGETRLSGGFTSSGGFQIADEDPSGPALGSLPSAPSAMPPNKASGATWWVLAVIVAIALGLAFFLA